MTQHISHAIDITTPLLIAASPEVANAIAPNDIVEILRSLAYCLSIVYAIVKLWKHYNPNDKTDENNDTPPQV